jgi:hypothetical protein
MPWVKVSEDTKSEAVLVGMINNFDPWRRRGLAGEGFLRKARVCDEKPEMMNEKREAGRYQG